MTCGLCSASTSPSATSRAPDAGTAPVCPECRHELALHIQLAERPVGAWLVAMIPLAGIALGALFLAAALVVIAIFEGIPPRRFHLVLFWTPLLIAAVFSILLWRTACPEGRRRFHRLTRRGKVARALAAWVITLGTFALWMFVLLEGF